MTKIGLFVYRWSRSDHCGMQKSDHYYQKDRTTATENPVAHCAMIDQLPKSSRGIEEEEIWEGLVAPSKMSGSIENPDQAIIIRAHLIGSKTVDG